MNSEKKSNFNYPVWLLFFIIPIIFSCESPDSNSTTSRTVNGISEKEIHIGSSLALDGHARYLGNQMLQGALSYINHINEKSPVHGRTIKVTALDDGYDPPKCLYNTQRLILEHKVFALFCYVGTPTTVRTIPLLNEAGIPLVGMLTGASRLRTPVNPYLINIRPSYYQETRAAVEYLVKSLGFNKIAVFYQYDEYGFDGLRGTEIALLKHGLKPVGKGSYIRGTKNVETGLNNIMRSRAQAVVMIGTYDPCARFIRLAKQQNFHPVFQNVSFVGSEALLKRLGEAGESVLITQVVPPPEPKYHPKQLPGVREYLSLLNKYYPESSPSFVGLEGYINARVLVEGLKRAGKNINRKKFIRAIESINDFDLGISSSLSFGPVDHQGLDRIYFTIIQDQQIKPL